MIFRCACGQGRRPLVRSVSSRKEAHTSSGRDGRIWVDNPRYCSGSNIAFNPLFSCSNISYLFTVWPPQKGGHFFQKCLCELSSSFHRQRRRSLSPPSLSRRRVASATAPFLCAPPPLPFHPSSNCPSHLRAWNKNEEMEEGEGDLFTPPPPGGKKRGMGRISRWGGGRGCPERSERIAGDAASARINKLSVK